jgi:2-polyprenyl-3-methyl-5-hydroxy-6-metoxy-1,4-benzoquinol methylase
MQSIGTNSDDVQRYWDTNAASFDSLYEARGFADRAFNKVFRRALFDRVEKTARRIVSNKPRAKVLDVGCGSGRTSIPLARAGAGHVTGVDFAPRMIELSKQAAKAAAVADKTDYFVADFAEHDFGSKFDFVVALGVLDYVQNAVPFVKRMFDLAENEAIFSVPKPSLVRANLRKLRYGRHGVTVHFYTPASIRELCSAAGASDVVIDPIPAGYLVYARR